MRFLKLFGAIGLSCVMATGASAQWFDDFDSYTLGPLAGQGFWHDWVGKSGVDGTVDNGQSFSAANSALIVANDDVVYDFANLAGGRPASGVWVASVMTYVPSGTTGIGWYIMMNDYPINLQWSVQTKFDASLGRVIDGANVRKLLVDQWVELVVAIDLDTDRYDSWYNGKTLAVNRGWKGTTGQDVLAALDLYGDAGGLTGLYFDNSRLEKTANGPLMLNATPNPAAAGVSLKFTSQSRLLASSDIGALFTWSVNGSPFILPLLSVLFDSTGAWTLSSTVPTGLAGIEVGLKMFALPSGGKIMLSNEEVVIFN